MKYLRETLNMFATGAAAIGALMLLIFAWHGKWESVFLAFTLCCVFGGAAEAIVFVGRWLWGVFKRPEIEP